METLDVKKKYRLIYIKDSDEEILSLAFGPKFTGSHILEACIHQIKNYNYNFLSKQLEKQKEEMLLTQQRIKKLAKKGEEDGDAATIKE